MLCRFVNKIDILSSFCLGAGWSIDLLDAMVFGRRLTGWLQEPRLNWSILRSTVGQAKLQAVCSLPKELGCRSRQRAPGCEDAGGGRMSSKFCASVASGAVRGALLAEGFEQSIGTAFLSRGTCVDGLCCGLWVVG